MSKDGGPAFPSANDYRVGEWITNGHPGMSLRDYAIIKFHAALLGQCDGYWGRHPEEAAVRAITHANAMLAEREKGKP